MSPGERCARRGVNVGYFSPSYHQREGLLLLIYRGREKSNLHRNLNLGYFSLEEGSGWILHVTKINGSELHYIETANTINTFYQTYWSMFWKVTFDHEYLISKQPIWETIDLITEVFPFYGMVTSTQMFCFWFSEISASMFEDSSGCSRHSWRQTKTLWTDRSGNKIMYSISKWIENGSFQ